MERKSARLNCPSPSGNMDVRIVEIRVELSMSAARRVCSERVPAGLRAMSAAASGSPCSTSGGNEKLPSRASVVVFRIEARSPPSLNRLSSSIHTSAPSPRSRTFGD